MPKRENPPTSCTVCDSDGDAYVLLVWEEKGEIWKRRYCASWVNPTCWSAYEHMCWVLGW